MTNCLRRDGRDNRDGRDRIASVALAFVAFAAFAVASPVASADVVIDRSSEIVLQTNAPYATRLAAEELNFFLKGVLGAALPVVERKTEGKTAIALGASDCGHAGRAPLPDGYVVEAVRRVGDNAPYQGVVRIFGDDDDVPVRSNDALVVAEDIAKTAALPDEAPWQPCFRRGTLFGVYAFLERFAGVRMYFPGELGTCIPKAERIIVPEGRYEDAPAFSVRRYGYDDGPVPETVLAGLDETSFKRLNWYRLRMETHHLRCCHGAKTHCLSPETWDAIFTNACAILSTKISNFQQPTINNQQPSATCQPPTTNYQLVFDAMPKDGFTWLRHCHCDWCEKNIPFSKTDTGFASDIVWRRTAELANRLKAKFPDARVSQMSYIPYARIPTNEIPENVDVFVARRGPWAEGTEIGTREKDEVRRWHDKLGRKVSLWNYPDQVDCWNLEMKDVPQLAPRAWAAYYRAVAPHVTGAFAESESDRWIYNYLNYYVFSRLCWNPDADVEAILAEHHRLMFGAAANEMAEFFDTLEQCWMKVVAKPFDTPLGPGVCEAPSEMELRTAIYSPTLLARLDALLRGAAAKVAAGSAEARRIALFRREYLEPLLLAAKDAEIAKCPVQCPVTPKPYANFAANEQYSEGIRIALVADIHVGDDNDASDLRRALRLFDAKKADAVIAAGDLTDFGLLSELKAVAAAWNEVFPGSRRSDGEPVVRLFHYGDHDTALNFKVRQREVVDKGRWADYIPHVGVDAAWRIAFGEPFEPVVRRTVKGCEFTLVHFLPEDVRAKLPQPIPPPGPSWLHVFSQHRMYRGLFARPGRGDEVSWDDGASLAFVTNVPNMVAVCGHGHISAASDTSLCSAAGARGNFAAIEIPSLYYQIETWLPRPRGDHGSHQALFLTADEDGIAVERIDIGTGASLGPDWRIP